MPILKKSTLLQIPTPRPGRPVRKIGDLSSYFWRMEKELYLRKAWKNNKIHWEA